MNERRAANAAYLPVFFRAETAERRIAVTVDDCRRVDVLRRMTDAACANGARLTLFPIGEEFAREGMAGLIRRCAFDLGFEVENHTWSHARIFRIPEDAMAKEIWAQSQALNRLLGVDYRQHFFRLMGGDGIFDRRTHNYLMQLGFRGVAQWSCCGSDVDMDEIMDQLRPGAIYLFHTVDEDAGKFERFLSRAAARGYRMVTLNELLGFGPNEISGLRVRAMPAPKPYAEDYRACGPGDYSWNIYRMQQKLLALGIMVFEAGPTGYYGEVTAQAVRRFQQLRGLPATGEADSATQRALLED